MITNQEKSTIPEIPLKYLKKDSGRNLTGVAIRYKNEETWVWSDLSDLSFYYVKTFIEAETKREPDFPKIIYNGIIETIVKLITILANKTIDYTHIEYYLKISEDNNIENIKKALEFLNLIANLFDITREKHFVKAN